VLSVKRLSRLSWISRIGRAGVEDRGEAAPVGVGQHVLSLRERPGVLDHRVDVAEG
jgi:hypothetical protein